MLQYKALIQDIMDNGEDRKDRTGVGTREVFVRELRFNLTEGFPLVTVKKTFFRGITYELLWFLRGETNIRPLLEENVHIWDEWAYQRYLKDRGLNKEILPRSPEWNAGIKAFTESILISEDFAEEHGELGPIYGKQWRDFAGFDQIDWVINEIKTNPFSRRLKVNAWNAAEISQMALPPCHYDFTFYVSEKNGLSCHMSQRSVDTLLGFPFNIASYALLTHMIAQVTNYPVYELVITTQATHIYKDQLWAVPEILSREPLALPTLELNSSIKDIEEFAHCDPLNDIKVIGYKSHPNIQLEVAV